MRIVGVLGLIFAVVFGLVAFSSLITLNTDITALTSGGVQALANNIPTIFMIFMGMVVIGLVIAVVTQL